MGRLISTEPTPTRRPPDSSTKDATSSLEIITLCSAYQAEVSAWEIPVSSSTATVSATSGVAVSSERVQRRKESNIGSAECRAVGCCIQASIMVCSSISWACSIRCRCLGGGVVMTLARTHPFQPDRSGIKKMAGARRMQNLKGVLRSGQFRVNQRVARQRAKSATKRRTSSTQTSESWVPCTIKGGAAAATPFGNPRRGGAVLKHVRHHHASVEQCVG